MLINLPQYNAKKGAAALIMVALLSLTILLMLVYVNFSPTTKENDVLSDKKAITQFKLGSDEALYRFNKSPGSFLAKYDMCDRKNGAVPVIYTNDSNSSGDFLTIDTEVNYSNTHLVDNSYVNGRGFLNRFCSVYADEFPYEGVEDYVVQRSDYPGLSGMTANNNGFIRLGILDREQNRGFLFSRDTLFDPKSGLVSSESQPRFVVFFNALTSNEAIELGNDGYLENTGKFRAISNLLDSRGIDATKENILTYFKNDLALVSDDAKIEVGLVEYDGRVTGSEGFEVNVGAAPRVIKRCICEASAGKSCGIAMDGGSIGSCSLNASESLMNNKVYFFYYKTLDKGSVVSFQMQDRMGNKIALPSGDLVVRGYGDDEKYLRKSVDVKKGVIGSDLSSGIFNYLYYSQN